MSGTVRLVAHVARGKLLLLLMLGLMMGGASLFAALLPEDDLASRVLFWVAAIFCLLCSLGVVRQFFRTGPVLEVGPEGVSWRRWSAKRIPWDAITRAADTSVERQRFVSLWLRDPGEYRSDTLLGRLAGANRMLGFGDIALSAQGLSCSHAELLAAVRANAPQLFA